MPKGHLMVIDPGVLTPSIESFNRISKVTPLNVSYHLPALFGPKSLLKATKDNNISGIIILGSANELPFKVCTSSFLPLEFLYLNFRRSA